MCSPRRTFVSQSPNDPIDPAALGSGLLRRAVIHLPECVSTNDEVRPLALAGEPEGAIVLADYQTAGRGRMGRAWQSPRGSSLLFSLLLRPPLAPELALQAVMAASLGVMQGIRRTTGLPARLKWPNDILINGKKTGGILCELGLDGGTLAYVIVGIGLNVNFDPGRVKGIPPDAASLQGELGRPQPRTALLRAILEAMEPCYGEVLRGSSLCAEWARALDTLGRRVKVVFQAGEITGTAESVDETGALVLRLDDGGARTIVAGDVVHLSVDDGPSTIDIR
jgi:BirA family biotin operon repressor/biotin-[acetyl-CoA-carboxylase] ligase